MQALTHLIVLPPPRIAVAPCNAMRRRPQCGNGMQGFKIVIQPDATQFGSVKFLSEANFEPVTLSIERVCCEAYNFGCVMVGMQVQSV